jgi:hypothetical protein
MNDELTYNPLDKYNLGTSVADAMLTRDMVSLGGLATFNGAGVYALYYSGAFASYREISNSGDLQGTEIPIYVGKAVSPGARKGNFGVNGDAGPALFKRLNEHAESIRKAANLNIADFHCRYLVVEDIWIPLGESLLIAKFSPLWNRHIDGFGNHDPGSGRYKQERSRWDTLHPGRAWALKCMERGEDASQISMEVEAYLQFAPRAQFK